MPIPYADVVPLGATAVRPSWDDLPAVVRAAVETREGQVVATSSSDAGFTPGFASVLMLAGGGEVFCKAADDATRGMFADAYRGEAALLCRLPSDLPAPALRWTAEVDGWVVVCFDAVDAPRHPRRPWTRTELHGALAVLEQVAIVPASSVDGLPAFADEYAELPAMWDVVDDPRTSPHRDELASLAGRALTLPHTEVLCHTDVRDDNLMRDASGRWWLCDWNWACRGPAWFDVLALLVSAHGDGHDADDLLVSAVATAGLAAKDVDSVLALLLGYFLTVCEQPVPPTSPSLRAHQRWYAEACWAWLASRRGWAGSDPSHGDEGPVAGG